MPNTKLQPYLFLGGHAEEAIELYCTVLGAKVEMVMKYKESPEPPQMPLPPGWENKVMHASLQIGNAGLMLSDGCGPNERGFAGFSLSISAADEADAKRIYAAITANGGEADMPLTKTFFSPAFGMLKDRFGICWMVLVPGQM
jgi:PhnB protein